jgi:hypothetical protein
MPAPVEVNNTQSYQVVHAQTPPAQPVGQPVDDAVNEISNRLRQESFLGIQHNDVSQGDLRAISDTLENLTPTERNEVISRLSEDQLNTWTDEADNGGFVGMGEGLSADERRDLNNTLAEGLDSQQLARVYNAWDGNDAKLDMATAIADRASADVRAEFVGRLADATTGGPASSSTVANGYGATTLTEDWNPHARSAAIVLGSLDGNQTALADAYGSLNDDQLQAVIQGAAKPFTSSSGGVLSTSYDTQTLADMIDAAATSTDPELKARIFSAAAPQLTEIADSGDGLSKVNPDAAEDARPVSEAMTRLLQSDVRGVVSALENDDPYGRALTGYLQEMVASGQNEKVGELIAELRLDVANAVPVANDPSTDADNDVVYPNAELLGYFSGATQAAIVNNGASAQEQAAVVEDIFMTVIELGAGGIGGRAGGISSAVAKGLTRGVVNEVTSAIGRETMDLRLGFYELAFPPDAGAAEDSYRSWESSVLSAN